MTVKVLGTLREVLGGKELALDFSGGTISDVIELLSARYGPKIKTELLDEQGNLDLSYVILAGNRRLTSLADEVRDGDEIVIMNVIAGGVVPANRTRWVTSRRNRDCTHPTED